MLDFDVGKVGEDVVMSYPVEKPVNLPHIKHTVKRQVRQLWVKKKILEI